MTVNQGVKTGFSGGQTTGGVGRKGKRTGGTDRRAGRGSNELGAERNSRKPLRTESVAQRKREPCVAKVLAGSKVGYAEREFRKLEREGERRREEKKEREKQDSLHGEGVCGADAMRLRKIGV